MVAEPTTGQEPTTPVGQEPTANPTATVAPGQEPEPVTFDSEYVKSLRKSEAETRRKLRDAEAELTKHRTAAMSETERLQQRVAELERANADYLTERQERSIRYAVATASNKLGIVDADAAYRLLDLAELETDDNGDPKDIEKALKDLLKKRPYLAAVTQQVRNINAGDGRGAPPPEDAKLRDDELIRRYGISVPRRQ